MGTSSCEAAEILQTYIELLAWRPTPLQATEMLATHRPSTVDALTPYQIIASKGWVTLPIIHGNAVYFTMATTID